MRRDVSRFVWLAGALVAAGLGWPSGPTPAVAATPPTVTAIAGTDNIGDGGPSTGAFFSTASGVVADAAGNIYIADAVGNRIRKIAPGGVISTFAGTGIAGFSGDGGPATAAQLNYPEGLAIDAAGNLYVADLNNQRVRMITSGGTITTIAGNGTYGYTGDGGPAVAATLKNPIDVAVNAAGTEVYVADSYSYAVRRIAGGSITTVAGTGISNYTGDGGAATGASLTRVTGIALDSAGTLLIAQPESRRVRQVVGGVITTVVGTGATGPGGDGGAANVAQMQYPYDVTATPVAGTYYVVDGPRIRKVTAGTITAFAGNGNYGNSGDGGPALAADMRPDRFALVGSEFVVTDHSYYGSNVRKISAANIITTIAGVEIGSENLDGLPVDGTRIVGVTGLSIDASGRVYAAYGTAFLGTFVPGGTYDVISDDAFFTPLFGVTSSGSVLVNGFDEILSVDPAGVSTTIAGTGVCGSAGDGGPATAATVCPRSPVLGTDGSITFLNQVSNFPAPQVFSIRRIDPAGIISTLQPTIAFPEIEPYDPAMSVDASGTAYGYNATGGTAKIVKSPLGGSRTTFDVPGSLVIGVQTDPRGNAIALTAEGGFGDPYIQHWVVIDPAGDVETFPVDNFVEGWKVGEDGNIYTWRPDGSGRGSVIEKVEGIAQSALEFSGLEPARLMDTRSGGSTVDGQFNDIGIRAAGSITELQVAGRAGVPDDASAVSLNVTATEAQAPGFLTIYPCGAPRPNASSVNYVLGDTVPNAVVTKIGDGGKVCVFTLAGTHVLVDVNGNFAPGSSFGPVVPARLLDTRPDGETVDGSFARTGLVAAGGTVELQVGGRGDVPSDAVAVSLNVTVTEAQAPGFVTVYPCGAARPNASNLNFRTGDTVPNAVLTKLGDGGKICLFALAGTHLIVDVNGFFAAGSSYGSLVPARLLDTRPDGETIDGAAAKTGLVAAGGTVELQVGGRGGVPADAGAVSLNVTVTETQGSGFVTVYPCGAARPNASNLNFVAGDTVPNAVLTKVGAGGTVCLFTLAGTHLLVDVNGYFPPG